MGKYSSKVGSETKEASEIAEAGSEMKLHSKMLDAETYKWWLEAIEDDDVSLVDEVLKVAESVEKNRLINGTFHYKKLLEQFNHSGNLSTINFQLTRPWCVAGVANAHNIMGLMLTNNVDVSQKDFNGGNIIHALILTACLEPTLEDKMNDTYTFLKHSLTAGDLRNVLNQANNEGFKPVEYAAHLGVFLIMQNIFKTEGIYMVEEDINSIHTAEWYIVDDYEKTDRTNQHWFSPLYRLMMLEENKVTDGLTNELFASSFVQNWVKIKMQINMPILILWFLIRGLFITSVVMTDIPSSEIVRRANATISVMTNNQNTTAETNHCSDRLWTHEINTRGNLVFIICSLIYALVVIVFDIIELFSLFGKAKFLKTPLGWKQPCLSYGFYRLTQLFQASLVVVQQISKICAVIYGTSLPVRLENLVYIFVTMSIVWSALFFIQLLPWIGHFVIAVVSMVLKLIKFLIIYLAFSFPFVGSFQHLLNSGKMQGNWPEEFSSFGYSFYTVFTVMLNMVDFRKFSPADETSVFYLHTVYVFMTAILLINLLIALFSTSFMRVDDHRQVVQTIQRLSVCWSIDRRMTTWLPCVHRWLTRRTFPKTMDGRYAVPSIVVCKKQQLKVKSGGFVSGEVSKKKRPTLSFIMR